MKAHFSVEAFIADTVLISAHADTGLQLAIIPNDDIDVISDKAFIPKKLGTVFVEIIQEGNNNYLKTSKKINFQILSPEG